MAAPMEEHDVDDGLLQDNYYSLLNLDKKATTEEVTAAFRKFSRIYHPDKQIDPDKKKDAELMFSKIKRAHEVLSDIHKKTVYDTYGEKGLESGGMEIISRTKSPAEIIAEYEWIQREREEQKLQQKTNPRGTISIVFDARDMFDKYDTDPNYEETPFFPHIEISHMNVYQSVEAPLTMKDTAVFGGNVHCHNGTGSGSFIFGWKRVTSNKGWGELELDVNAGSGLGGGMKGFRRLTKHCFGTVGLTVNPVSGRLKFGASFMLAYQLDRNLQARMILNTGMTQALTTAILWDSHRHHASFSVHLGLLESFVTVIYIRKFEEEDGKLRVALRGGTVGAFAECAYEKKISKFSTLGVSMTVGLPPGVMLKIKLVRGSQTFLFPIHLSEHVMPSAVLYGMAVPFVAYHFVKNFVVQPFLQHQKKQELEKKKREHAEMVLKKKREAENAVQLMKETVERIIETEEKNSGLIILKALFGKLSESDEQGKFQDGSFVDVTVPLQALVKDSKLVIPGNLTKCGLVGFYDPCIGEDKSLYINYKFRNKLHNVTLQDKDRIKLPLEKHVVKDTDHSNRSRS